MKKLVITFVLFFSFLSSRGQTVEELFLQQDYEGLTKFENQDWLTGEQFYKIGYAFYMLGKDEKAVDFFDRAILKGLDKRPYIHYYKALALNHAKNYEEALEEIEIAIQLEPENQEYLSGKGLIYFDQNKPDEAIAVFEQAKKLPRSSPLPYYMIPEIHYLNKDYVKSLAGFYDALFYIPRDNKYYLMTLDNIGRIETTNKNYDKAYKAYLEAIELRPKSYDFYPKLIRVYTTLGKYAKADSIFMQMKVAYERMELPAEYMESKMVLVHEYDWQGQRIVVNRLLPEAKVAYDLIYKVFVYNLAGDSVSRTFMVEKTIKRPDGLRNILCERDKRFGAKYTYPYGWKTDIVPLDDLKRVIGLVLEGKLKYNPAVNVGK